MQRLATGVINFTSDISDREVERAVRAVNRQIAEDFFPVWRHARIAKVDNATTRHGDSGADPGREHDKDSVIYLVDERSIVNALQYRWTSAANIPMRFVYADFGAWSVPLSHEILELTLNPSADAFVQGPDPRGVMRSDVGLWHAQEVCDAVERTTYSIDGIEVSNFVTPRYFSLEDTDVGRTDFLGTGVPSFGLLPGCHISVVSPMSGELEVIRSSDGDRGITIESPFYFHQFQRPVSPESTDYGEQPQITRMISTVSDVSSKTRRLPAFPTGAARSVHPEPPAVHTV